MGSTFSVKRPWLFVTKNCLFLYELLDFFWRWMEREICYNKVLSPWFEVIVTQFFFEKNKKKVCDHVFSQGSTCFDLSTRKCFIFIFQVHSICLKPFFLMVASKKTEFSLISPSFFCFNISHSVVAAVFDLKSPTEQKTDGFCVTICRCQNYQNFSRRAVGTTRVCKNI